MKKRVLLLISGMLFLNFGCSSDDNQAENDLKRVTGFYKVISFESNKMVDLNGDGVLSTELLDEINIFQYQQQGYLEIRPTYNNRNFLWFTIPHTNLTIENTSDPNGYVIFTRSGFSTWYDLVGDSINLEDYSYEYDSWVDNVKTVREVFLDPSMEIIDESHLSLKLTKEYYDFNINDWTPLEINIIYEKIVD